MDTHHALSRARPGTVLMHFTNNIIIESYIACLLRVRPKPSRTSTGNHLPRDPNKCSRSVQDRHRGEHAQRGNEAPYFPLWDKTLVPAAGEPRLFPNPNTGTEHATFHPEQPYAASPPCRLLASFFCLRAAGLKTALILPRPPNFSHVHTNTTAKLNKM